MESKHAQDDSGREIGRDARARLREKSRLPESEASACSNIRSFLWRSLTLDRIDEICARMSRASLKDWDDVDFGGLSYLITWSRCGMICIVPGMHEPLMQRLTFRSTLTQSNLLHRRHSRDVRCKCHSTSRISTAVA